MMSHLHRARDASLTLGRCLSRSTDYLLLQHIAATYVQKTRIKEIV
jgi:hypothetical protein